MRLPTIPAALLALSLLTASLVAQAPDRDSDGDGLSDFAELHKYKTDPHKADSDGDGIPDGDWRERREYQYTVRLIVQAMRPVTPEFLCDDYQDVRVLDETADHVELEVVLYPFADAADTIVADPDWRRTTAKMTEWTKPGPTADWTPAMQQQLLAALQRDGIDAANLDDKTLVERASRWLCAHAKPNNCFTVFYTSFGANGAPSMAPELAGALQLDAATLAKQWPIDVSARGMFEQGRRGTCSSSAIYLNGCLRALGVPTRIAFTIPVIDAGDERERAMLKQLTHQRLREQLLTATAGMTDNWCSHSLNEVFVGGRWRRLNYQTLGQGIADPSLFGLIVHIATFSDWADAKMPATIGRRQALHQHDDTFGFGNPYSTIALRDEFGAHCTLPNLPPEPLRGRVTALQWGDGPEVDDDIRSWFAERKKSGLVARVEGPKSSAELQRFLAAVDRRARLIANGKPPLAVELADYSFWWRGDHAQVFVPLGPADQRVVADADYQFVLRNDSADRVWDTALPLPVPKRARH